MKIHGRNCDYREKPCTSDHEYLCAACGNAFTTNKDSFFQHPFSYRVSPSLFYPACSFTCYSTFKEIDLEVIREGVARQMVSQTEVDEILGTDYSLVEQEET